jgi:malonyl CoA-acyl carrier protein transacylase/phosphopantetheinyl transferase
MTPRRHRHDRFDTELCLVGAASDAALPREVQRLRHVLEAQPDLALADVAFTLAQSSREAPAVLAMVARDVPDLCGRLHVVEARLAAGAARIRDKAGTYYFRQRLRPERGLVFLFPGETAYYPEMLRDLCLVFDVCREAFDEAEAACEGGDDGFRPGDCLFGGAGARAEAGVDPLPRMPGALVCTHAANTALARLMTALGVRPDAVLGHSSGECAALEFAGVYGTLHGAERVRFLREGRRLCAALAGREDLPARALLTIEDPPPDWAGRLPGALRDAVAPIMLNGPRQVVAAVPAEATDACFEALRQAGVRATRLGLRRAYHTADFEPAAAAMQAFVRRWARHAPRLPVYSCLDAAPLPADANALAAAVSRQWCGPVRFGDTIERLYADGFRVFVELGPRGNLSMRVGDVLDGRPHASVALDRIHRPGLSQLHHALAMLAAHGTVFHAAALHAQRPSRLLDLHRAATPRRGRAEPSVALSAALPEIGACDFGVPLAPPAGVTAVVASPAPLRRANFGADFPLLAGAETLAEKPGASIELAKTFAVDDYPFIRDYAPGSHHVSVSRPGLGGLPMLSPVTCIEIMAEAARRLAPRKRVVQVDDLRGKRIVTFERGETRIVIHAERIEWQEPGVTAVRVSLRAPASDGRFTLPMAEATCFLASLPPERETARPTPLRGPQTVNWTGAEIYPDRLYQGRLLQSVTHVYQWGEDGLDYEITVPSRAEAVRGTRFPLFSVWPLVMDGVSSGIGLWRGREKNNGVLTLPFRARTIRLFATVLPEGARLRAYLRITAQTPHSYVADVSVTDGRGRVVLSATGWEELICSVSPPLHALYLRPADAFLTADLPVALLGETPVPVRGSLATDLPRQIFENQQEIWLRAAAFALLGPAERDEWLAMRGAAGRRVEWLLGRACVKDAIRRHLADTHQQRWAAADIAIWTDDSGKPHAHGPWLDRTGEAVDVSIAHTTGLVAAAIAVNGRIGIDLEKVGRDLSEDFTRSVFAPDEQELAARSGEGPLALLRFWCAKEALAKALGTGIRYSPSDLRVRGHRPDEGRLDLELAGQWRDAFRTLHGRTLSVCVTPFDGHILATCVIPASLLPAG